MVACLFYIDRVYIKKKMSVEQIRISIALLDNVILLMQSSGIKVKKYDFSHLIPEDFLPPPPQLSRKRRKEVRRISREGVFDLISSLTSKERQDKDESKLYYLWCTFWMASILDCFHRLNMFCQLSGQEQQLDIEENELLQHVDKYRQEHRVPLDLQYLRKVFSVQKILDRQYTCNDWE